MVLEIVRQLLEMHRLVIKVLISADSKRRKPFISCIEKICDDSKDRYKWRFLSDEVADLREQDRLKRMFECLMDCHLIFMDVTPIECTSEGIKNHWMTNQGVLIEYGAIMTLEYLRDRLKLFCESSVERNRLHPYFLKTADSYSEKNINDVNNPKSLRNMVIEKIKRFENRMHEEYRILKKDSSSYKYVLKRALE